MAGKTQTGLVKAGQGGTKMGRPTKYSDALAREVCQLLATGVSMRTVSKLERMPSMNTLFRWLQENEDFREQYARAKQESADAMAEEILDIADDATNDWMEANADEEEKERYSFNGEHVQRSKLRIETRKFLMAKMKPKVYGDQRDPAAPSTINFNFGTADNYVKGDVKSPIIEGEVSPNAG